MAVFFLFEECSSFCIVLNVINQLPGEKEPSPTVIDIGNFQ
jgi:hypothetical protein